MAAQQTRKEYKVKEANTGEKCGIFSLATSEALTGDDISSVKAGATGARMQIRAPSVETEANGAAATRPAPLTAR